MERNAVASCTRQITTGGTKENISTCPICGKVFVWYTGHAYTLRDTGHKYRAVALCSWSCFRKAEKQCQAEKAKARELARKKNRESARKAARARWAREKSKGEALKQ